ncbi:MAG: glycine--tRNA ligase subunit beta [Aerococcus sp.]|nr:glycine--tRNA ligase subunit beta [Aerococcus sp.]
MNNHTYLVEVLVEEMPAQYVRQITDQFKERVAAFLKDNRLDYEDIKVFATPRRFAVLVNGLADKQTDLSETAKGPAKAIALNEDGEWTKAAQGFARGQGADVDDIYFAELKGKEYAYIDIKHPGQNSAVVLPGISDVIRGMNFPVRMYWDSHQTFQYIRPIHGIVSLLDKDVLPFTMEGILAGNTTLGHRFLSQDAVEIPFAGAYEEKLQEHFVIADQDKRKAKIEKQIEAIEARERVRVHEDPELLEEVTQIVEWPTAFLGHFDEKYLSLPAPVLITSMRDNQRYFAVDTEEGTLAPAFVALRNGNEEHLNQVRQGNEKVLVARLEDALFFVDEDKKHTIDEFKDQLTGVTFHGEISNMADKMARSTAVAKQLYNNYWETTDVFAGELFDEFMAKIDRTGAIYKFDLVTQIVDEFSELQGVIGDIYAKEAGEDPEVAQAIREHYLPLAAGGDLPESPLGLLFAIADKLDTIISFFKINKIPSGSNDPYALRRQMIGIVAMIRHYQLPLNWVKALPALLKDIYGVEDPESQAQLTNQIIAFMDDRVKTILKDQDIRLDISEASRSARLKDINTIIQTAKALDEDAKRDGFKETAEAWQRVVNLGMQKEESMRDQWRIQPDAFETDSERDLYEQVKALNFDVSPESRLDQLDALEGVITQFFIDNMVMSDDEVQQKNRLTLLEELADFILGVADVRAIQEK